MYDKLDLEKVFNSIEHLSNDELYAGEQLMYRVLFKTHPSDISGTYSLARAFQRGLYARNFNTFKQSFNIAMQEAKLYKFNVTTPDFSDGIHRFMTILPFLNDVNNKEYSKIIDEVCSMYKKHLKDIDEMDKERGITITSKSIPIEDFHLKNEITKLLESGKITINGGL